MTLENKKTPLIIVLAIILLVLGILVYSNKHTSPQMLSATPTPSVTQDLSTTYVGKLPCADCEGIEEELILTRKDVNSSEGTYILKDTYLGKDAAPIETTGKWTTDRGSASDPNAVVYVLNYDKPDEISYFLRVDENIVRMLDRNKAEIDSPFNQTLTKKE